jgi:hypothetical protein
MILHLLAVAHGAACPEPVPVVAFDEAVARAELAVQTLDAVALETAIAAADAALPCLAEPVGSEHLARWYRARAVHRFVSGDVDAAAELFRAARGLQPAYPLDPDLGAPIQEAYRLAEPGAVARALPRPSEGWVVIDGRSLPSAPADRPFVVQWFGSDGALKATTLVPPGAELPYPAAPPSAQSVLPAPVVIHLPPPPAPVVVEQGHPSRALAVSGLAAGLLSGAGIAVASTLKQHVLLSDEPIDPRDGIVTANRAVGYGAGVAGVAAIGLGVGAVVVGRW